MVCACVFFVLLFRFIFNFFFPAETVFFLQKYKWQPSLKGPTLLEVVLLVRLYNIGVAAAEAVPQCPQRLMVAMFGPEGSKEDCGKNSIAFFLSSARTRLSEFAGISTQRLRPNIFFLPPRLLLYDDASLHIIYLYISTYYDIATTACIDRA